MRFTLTIDCDNDAFHEPGVDDKPIFVPEGELSRLVRLAAEKIRLGRTEFPILDINGNAVGHATMEDA